MKFLTIAKKEIIDITRDRRTIIMMIVVPLFLIPVLIGTITKISFSQAKIQIISLKLIKMVKQKLIFTLKVLIHSGLQKIG